MAKGKSPVYSSRGASARLSQSQKTVVRELAKGQLNLGVSWLTGQTYTQNVEVTPMTWSATAAGGDKFYSYIRMKFGCASLAGSVKYLRWFLARWVIADGTPDLSTADTLEQFQKDRRILKRGSFVQNGFPSGNLKSLGFTLRNIRIPDGERLGLIVINQSATAADFNEWFEFEQREITIS